MLKIAHFSDLHFFKLDRSLSQFFSKRWLGNFNAYFKRKHYYNNNIPFSLLPFLKQLKVSVVCISGDFTTTGQEVEYQIAQEFIRQLNSINIRVYCVPGNHDHYTKKMNQEKIFYRYFSQLHGIDSLKNHRVSTQFLNKEWALVMLDTTHGCPFYLSTGKFCAEIEYYLEKEVEKIPASYSILIMNHFPCTDREGWRRELVGKQALCRLMKKRKQIALYLHGHTHQRSIENLHQQHLPIVLDSGSVGHQKGTWSLLDLDRDTIKITPYILKETWTPEKSVSFMTKSCKLSS